MANSIEMTDEAGLPPCETLALQNDAFRNRQPAGGQGQWVCTTAVDNEGPAFVAACIAAVQTYDDFKEENDPHGTRDMGFMTVMGREVWFKIDLYNPSYDAGSSEPENLDVTRRVLTVLFPSDY
ncbi:DUF3768 domain-containing protein [Ruegeria halocynthiae]|uniref:DUF3768 domain-containing protein n=1 Tax=Ruegeria halocynthiae TaxID=985054 RepID=UPI00136337D2|nr:DUF3768 domain-containing protein [Ruegeria halocynthiae]